jgi:hypothetical protein
VSAVHVAASSPDRRRPPDWGAVPHRAAG